MERGDANTNHSGHWRFSADNYNNLLPPRPLAEELEPEVAIAGLRHCMTLRKPEGLFHSAWHHVEYAMNQQAEYFDDSLRRKYFGDAMWLLASIIDPGSHQRKRQPSPDLYAQVLTLNTYLPVFIKRALNTEITPEDCDDIYRSFGVIFNDIHKPDYRDSSYLGARSAEMIGHALSARTRRPELLLFPASPREEASNQQALNHDGYFIGPHHKIPMQTKLVPTDKSYEMPTRTIYIEPLAEHALKRAQSLPADAALPLGEYTKLIAKKISEESSAEIDRASKLALDFMTRSVAARYEYELVAA